MTDQQTDKGRELANALLNNPWAPEPVRETCRALAKKWAKEDVEAQQRNKGASAHEVPNET